MPGVASMSSILTSCVMYSVTNVTNSEILQSLGHRSARKSRKTRHFGQKGPLSPDTRPISRAGADGQSRPGISVHPPPQKPKNGVRGARKAAVFSNFGKYTLNCLHHNPSPVSGDGPPASYRTAK